MSSPTPSAPDPVLLATIEHGRAFVSAFVNSTAALRVPRADLETLSTSREALTRRILQFANSFTSSLTRSVLGVYETITGANVSGSDSNPEVARRARLRIDPRVEGLVSGLSTEQFSTLSGVLQRGFDEGLPPDRLARLISSHVGLSPRDSKQLDSLRLSLTQRGVNPAEVDRRVLASGRSRLASRAATIAQTEITRAVADASLFDWELAVSINEIPDSSRKAWSAPRDERTDSVCKALDGRVVQLKEPFITPEWQGLAPPAHPNCRCSLVLILPSAPSAAAEPQASAFALGKFNPSDHPRDRWGRFARIGFMRFDPFENDSPRPKPSIEGLRSPIKLEPYYGTFALSQISRQLGIPTNKLQLGSTHGHVDQDIARGFFNQFSRLFGDYPLINGALGSVTVLPSTRDYRGKPDTDWKTDAIAVARPTRRALHLNPAFLGTSRSTSEIRDSISPQFSLYGQPIRSILGSNEVEKYLATHEAGHFLEHRLMTRRGGLHVSAWHDYFRAYPESSLGVSPYGRTSWVEGFAELFAARVLIPRSRWPRELRDWDDVYEQTRPRPRRASDEDDDFIDSANDFECTLSISPPSPPAAAEPQASAFASRTSSWRFNPSDHPRGRDGRFIDSPSDFLKPSNLRGLILAPREDHDRGFNSYFVSYLERALGEKYGRSPEPRPWANESGTPETYFFPKPHHDEAYIRYNNLFHVARQWMHGGNDKNPLRAVANIELARDLRLEHGFKNTYASYDGDLLRSPKIRALAEDFPLVSKFAQEHAKANLGSTFVLYRGLVVPKSTGFQADTNYNVGINGLSSWSRYRDAAKLFAEGITMGISSRSPRFKTHEGIVVAKRFRVEDLFFNTDLIGDYFAVGKNLKNFEFVMKSRQPTTRVRVVSKHGLVPVRGFMDVHNILEKAIVRAAEEVYHLDEDPLNYDWIPSFSPPESDLENPPEDEGVQS